MNNNGQQRKGISLQTLQMCLIIAVAVISIAMFVFTFFLPAEGASQGWIVALRLAVVVQALVLCLLIWLAARLGIQPILGAVERIKEEKTLQEGGGQEFQVLAKAYNKLFAFYQNNQDRLNLKDSFDEMTRAYNRSGYDLLLSRVDLETTYLLLFDLDDFKRVNETYGRDTGDKVLKKLVQILKHNFRSEDYVCRIEGDQFAVFMVHSAGLQNNLIVKKIEAINAALADTSDKLPAVSASVGIVHGTDAADPAEFSEKAGGALYQSKQRGKHTYTFLARL